MGGRGQQHSPVRPRAFVRGPGGAPPPLRRPERVNYIACGASVAMTIRHVEGVSDAGCVRSLVAACGCLKRLNPLAPIDGIASEQLSVLHIPQTGRRFGETRQDGQSRGKMQKAVYVMYDGSK